MSNRDDVFLAGLEPWVPHAKAPEDAFDDSCILGEGDDSNGGAAADPLKRIDLAGSTTQRRDNTLCALRQLRPVCLVGVSEFLPEVIAEHQRFELRLPGSRQRRNFR